MTIVDTFLQKKAPTKKDELEHELFSQVLYRDGFAHDRRDWSVRQGQKREGPDEGRHPHGQGHLWNRGRETIQGRSLSFIYFRAILKPTIFDTAFVLRKTFSKIF